MATLSNSLISKSRSLLPLCRLKPISAKVADNARTVFLTAKIDNWNKDWKAGPYPTTEAEKVAAAKKYGMRREDYEPYEDDGMGWGDYPKFTAVTGSKRDHYYPWDSPYLLRNYGEPLHIDAHIYNEERLDISHEPNVPYPTMIAMFLGVMVLWWGMFLVVDNYKNQREWMDPQYPYNENGERVIHYTFEPVDS